MDNKKYTVSERIKCGLDLRNMKAVELSRKTGLTKSIISQYMSGRTVPKQDNMFLIAKALDIWPTWLMGYDVEIKPFDYESVGKKCDDCICLVRNTESFKMPDDSMQNIGIIKNDTVFYLQNTEFKNNSLIIIELENKKTVRRYKIYDDLVVLKAENVNYKDIILKDENIKILGIAIAFQRILLK